MARNPSGIGVGGVDKIEAGAGESVEQGEAHFLVHRPAEHIAAEAKRINFQAGAAKLATLSLINAGCDFIFHQANEAGRGVFQACSERKVRCFGSNKNQNDLAPDVILASAVLDMPSAFVYMARTVRDHRFQPHVYWLGMREGIVSLAWNARLKPTISPRTIVEVARVQKQIREGTFQVPRGKF